LAWPLEASTSSGRAADTDADPLADLAAEAIVTHRVREQQFATAK
jgi:hypothetical protein